MVPRAGFLRSLVFWIPSRLKKLRLSRVSTSNSLTFIMSSQESTVFVGRLAWSIDESRLAQEFAQFGSIQSTKVIKDRMTGRSKGFGYVEYSSPAEAQAALAMSGTEIEGMAVNVDISQPRVERAPRQYQSAQGGAAGGYQAPREPRTYPKSEPSTTVFIGNLSFQASEQDIASTFAQCGPINQIRLPRYHDTGKMKGYAYLEFQDLESATKCINLSDVTIAGRPVRLDYSQPRPDRAVFDSGMGGNGGAAAQDAGLGGAAPMQY